MHELGNQLTAALRLTLEHAALLSEAYWEGLTGGQRQCACLLNEHGWLVRATRSFENVLRDQSLLRVSNGRVVATNLTTASRLSAVLAAAASRTQPRATVVTLPRSGKRPAILAFYPLVRERNSLLFSQATVLAVLTKLGDRADVPETTLREIFGLTKRESQIAALLANGDDIDAVAEALGNSRETVRVHLKAIFSKLGVRRQSELIRVLTLMSDIAVGR